MASSRNKSRNRGKRPTATIDLKAKDVSEKEASPKVDASKVLSRGTDSNAPKTDAAKSEASRAPSDATGKASAATGSEKSATPEKSSGPSARDTSSAKSSEKKPDAAKASTASKPTSSGAKSATKASATPEAAKGDKSGGKGGGFTHLLAGGLGGVLALVGATQFDLGGGAGGSTSTGSTATQISPELASRLSALEQKETQAAKVEVPAAVLDRLAKLESLNAQLSKIEASQSKLSSETTALASTVKTLADPAGGGASELRRRLDSMEGTIASLGKAAEGATDKAIPQLAALAGRMNDMRTELTAKIAVAQKTLSGDVEKRIAKVDESLQAVAGGKSTSDELMATLKGGAERLSLGLETARTETTRIASDVASLRTSNDAAMNALDGLKQLTSTFEERLKGMESQAKEDISALPSKEDVAAAVAPVSDRIAALQEQLGGVIQRETVRADSAKNVLLSIELANLQRALDQGRPVEKEIENLKKSAPEGIDLTALDKLAQNDVLSHDALAKEFSGAASSAIQAETLDENASTFDKLFANARSIVRVRKTGDVEGNTTEAAIARAEDNLKRNDLAGALKELSILKDKAAAAMATWVTKAKDRLSVDVALAKLEDGLKASVSSSATN